MVLQDLKEVMKGYPTLRTSGFGVAENQNDLLDHLQECNISCDWFKLTQRCKRPNRKIGSTYGLKAKAERWSDTYIPEGAFIAAAIHSGFELFPKRGTTSAFLNISSKSKINGQWI
jgi:hypothetical protein